VCNIAQSSPSEGERGITYVRQDQYVTQTIRFDANNKGVSWTG